MVRDYCVTMRSMASSKLLRVPSGQHKRREVELNILAGNNPRATYYVECACVKLAPVPDASRSEVDCCLVIEVLHTVYVERTV